MSRSRPGDLREHFLDAGDIERSPAGHEGFMLAGRRQRPKFLLYPRRNNAGQFAPGLSRSATAGPAPVIAWRGMNGVPSASSLPPPPERLSGLVERVTFHSEETGFAVLRVKVKGQRDLVTIIGTVASVNAGEWLSAQGAWVRDKEHGLQFKAHFLKCSPPTSREGMEKYLASGMIKGIGPVYARKLVERFGEGIFDVSEHESARLEEVEGIGPGRRRRIKAAWAEQKVVRDIMVFLHGHGVSTSRAVRIYKTYGEGAVEAVRANPYRLAKDIHGIGFKTADAVAQKLGISKDSLLRARAGLVHALLEATQEGHCALPEELLVESATRLLEVEEVIVTAALQQMLTEAEVVREEIGERELIYLPALQRAEGAIATSLCARAACPPCYPEMDLTKAIDWVQQKTGKALAPSQREALAKAFSCRVLVITGGPGVGKTTLVHSILWSYGPSKCAACSAPRPDGPPSA